MLGMRELLDEEYNIDYAPIVRLEELLAPDQDGPESSDDHMIDIPLEDDSLDEALEQSNVSQG